MKTNMTERDKRLLFVLSVLVIIVAIGYWGIRPQVKRFNKLESLVEQQEEQKKVNQLKIANVGAIQAQADEYEAKVAEEKDEFYQIMNSSEIDRMMTQLAIEKGLEIYNLQFSMPKSPSNRMAYQYSSLYERQQALISEYNQSDELDDLENSDMMSLDEDTDSDNNSSDKNNTGTVFSLGKASAARQQVMSDIEGDPEGSYQPNTDIYAVPVTMTVGGELDDLDSFIESIINMDSRVLLVGYSWGQFKEIVKRDVNGNIISTSSSGKNTSEAASSASETTAADSSNVTIEVVTKKSLTVRLEIYMCDTSNVATESDATADSDAEESIESEDIAE